MKIFGVGLSKTGTESLHLACLALGFSSKHWDYTKTTMRMGPNGPEIDPSKFEPFDAYFDTPIARFYRDLDHYFPGSKFILTERDTEEWLRSYKAFFRALPAGAQVNERLRMELYGTLGHEDEILRKHYEQHNQGVKAYFRDRPDDLLCLTIGKGQEWGQLCTFLRVPVPDRSFPRSNTKLQNKVWALYHRYFLKIGTLVPQRLRHQVAGLIWPHRYGKK